MHHMQTPDAREAHRKRMKKYWADRKRREETLKRGASARAVAEKDAADDVPARPTRRRRRRQASAPVPVAGFKLDLKQLQRLGAERRLSDLREEAEALSRFINEG